MDLSFLSVKLENTQNVSFLRQNLFVTVLFKIIMHASKMCVVPKKLSKTV